MLIPVLTLPTTAKHSGSLHRTAPPRDVRKPVQITRAWRYGTGTEGTEEYQEINFKILNEITTKTSNLAEFCSTAKNKTLSEMEQFETRGSQWKFNSILKMELRINKYNPLRGSSYIPLPKVLANKKAIINVQNEDNKRFLWSILSALHSADKYSYRVSKYEKCENEYNEPLNGIYYPITLGDISKFVRRIKHFHKCILLQRR
jgi:hypothetical protein